MKALTLERLKEIEQEYKDAWKLWSSIITHFHRGLLRDNMRVISLLIKECEENRKINHFKESEMR